MEGNDQQAHVGVMSNVHIVYTVLATLKLPTIIHTIHAVSQRHKSKLKTVDKNNMVFIII